MLASRTTGSITLGCERRTASYGGAAHYSQPWRPHVGGGKGYVDHQAQVGKTDAEGLRTCWFACSKQSML